MTDALRIAALFLLLLNGATGAFAGPVTGADLDPLPAPSGWNNTDVDVLITVRSKVRGSSSITYEIFGAQKTKPTTVPGIAARAPVTIEGESTVQYVGRDDSGPGGTRKQVVRLDKRPPRSELGIALLPNDQGYTVTITAQDPATPSGNSGVKEIRFNVDGFGPNQVVAGDTAVVTLPRTGWTQLIYWAVDHAGNAEYPYNDFTRDPGLRFNPPGRLEFTAPVGQEVTSFLTVGQANPMFPADIEAITSDSPWFWPSGSSCIGSMTGVVACYVDVSFYAPDALEHDATLYFKTNDPNQTYYTVQLHGRGTLPGLLLSPDPVEFPITQVGSSSAPVTVSVTNDGGAPLVISGISTGSAAFAVVDNRCGPAPFALAPLASCGVDVAFTPFGYGLHPGAFEVQSNLAGAPRSVPFEAFGSVSTQLTSAPAMGVFGTVPVGDNAKIDFEIGNAGSVPFGVQGFSMAGAGAAMYRIARASCTNGAAPTWLEPRQLCRITVVYFPTAAGVHDAALRVVSSIGQPPFDVPVTGTSP